MGYEIILCMVEAVDIKKQLVTLEPLQNHYLKRIDSSVSSGLRFASDYAPYIRVEDESSRKIANTPVGFVNYPQRGDYVIALVWITDISEMESSAPLIVQNQQHEVIILSKVNWTLPYISTYDNILGDQSGAKLHFNHGWLDTVNVGKDALSEDAIHLRTGHTTLIGNRLVTLGGQKFLPFGIHSHLLGLYSKNRSQTKVTDEEGVEHQWDALFTQDPTETVYDGLLSESSTGENKFLEPPCPEPGAMMNMHDSGYKHLVEPSGHVRMYMPEGVVMVIGDDFTNNLMRKVAFAPLPDEQDEATKFPLQAPGESLRHWVDDSGAISTLKMNQGGDADTSGLVELEINGISMNITDGALPTSFPVTFGGETVIKNRVYLKFGDMSVDMNATDDAVIFTMAGGLVFTIDGANNKVVVSAGAGFEFTGDLLVTGAIEATTTLTAGTKVITPAVSDS